MMKTIYSITRTETSTKILSTIGLNIPPVIATINKIPIAYENNDFENNAFMLKDPPFYNQVHGLFLYTEAFWYSVRFFLLIGLYVHLQFVYPLQNYSSKLLLTGDLLIILFHDDLQDKIVIQIPFA